MVQFKCVVCDKKELVNLGLKLTRRRIFWGEILCRCEVCEKMAKKESDLAFGEKPSFERKTEIVLKGE